MPTYPTFPLTPAFSNGYSTECLINQTQYNQGGVINRGLRGINPLKKTFNFSVATDKISQTETFLEANLGKSFKLSFDGGITVQPELWRLSGYNWLYYSQTVRGLSCEMRQVYRLK